jgi:hypothetical protein
MDDLQSDCRRKRNTIDYTFSNVATETEAKGNPRPGVPVLRRSRRLDHEKPPFTENIATEISPDEPSAVAPCDDLSNFASRRVSSLARKSTHLTHQRGMKLRILG